jgi:hypothetical protein
MRYLFTDRWNSFWHAVFGACALYCPIIIPIFLLYQIIQGKPNDLVIDTSEFFIGLFISFIVSKIMMRPDSNVLKKLLGKSAMR